MKINFKDLILYFLTYNNPIRKNHIEQEFKEYNLVEMTPNLDETSRFKSGCTGWLKILDKALQDQDKTKSFKPFIVIEDDVSILNKKEEYDIPDDTDILYIGISCCGSLNNDINNGPMFSKNFNDDISRIYNMLSTHGLMICSITGLFILQKCLMEAYFKDIHYDMPISKIQPYYKVYCLNEPFVYQDLKYGGQENVTKIKLIANYPKLPFQFLNTTYVCIKTSNIYPDVEFA